MNCSFVMLAMQLQGAMQSFSRGSYAKIGGSAIKGRETATTYFLATGIVAMLVTRQRSTNLKGCHFQTVENVNWTWTTCPKIR